jgi:hypothetical protein
MSELGPRKLLNLGTCSLLSMRLLWTCRAWELVSESTKPLVCPAHPAEIGKQLSSSILYFLNPFTAELNSSAQRCLTRYFTGDFASWTVHFVNICVKNQQMHQLFIQFINYVWYLLHVSTLHWHPQGAFLVPSERCPSRIFYRLLLN